MKYGKKRNRMKCMSRRNNMNRKNKKKKRNKRRRWKRNKRNRTKKTRKTRRLISNRRKYGHVTPLLRDVVHGTGCQSHSASITSSVYSSFNHYTELFQSTCAIAALGLIPPRLGYVSNDHLRRPISGCEG